MNGPIMKGGEAVPGEMHSDMSLGLVCVVCERERQSRVLGVLNGRRSFCALSCMAHGTANSKMLGYLGLGETEKAVFLCVMPAHTAAAVLGALQEKLELQKPGHGAAFVCRVYAGCYHRPVVFAGEEGIEEMEQSAAYDVIMAVLNRGYTEEAMNAARAAGATGGTVLHARGCGLAGADRFFGVTIQPERELVFILARRADSAAIMSAIAREAGPDTDAHAVSFAMPASSVAGLAGM